MKRVALFLSILCFSAQANDEVLNYIKNNYEYNIQLIETTYAEHGIHLDLDEADRTIDLKKLEEIKHPHPLAEVGYQTNLMKKRFKKRITSLEAELLKTYPRQAYYVGFQSHWALSKTKELYQKNYIGKDIDLTDPTVDSFKHTYWSHLLTNKINPEFAKLWFTARELRKLGSGLVDLRESSSGYMDMLNNVIGMKIPEDTFMDRLLGASVPSQITRKQKYGQLFFNDGGDIRTTDQID